MTWIDSHCHLDANEFAADRDEVRAAARAAGVATCVIPAVEASNFDTVRLLAHQYGDVYALGIHPMYTPQAAEADLLLHVVDAHHPEWTAQIQQVQNVSAMHQSVHPHLAMGS
jgi:TatD DNase family protein